MHRVVILAGIRGLSAAQSLKRPRSIHVCDRRNFHLFLTAFGIRCLPVFALFSPRVKCGAVAQRLLKQKTPKYCLRTADDLPPRTKSS